MLNPPFDELPNVTKAVELYKNGNSLLKIACLIGATQKQVRKALIFAGMPLKQRGGIRVKDECITVVKKVGKYDYLLFEPINQGHDYKDIVKKQTSLNKRGRGW